METSKILVAGSNAYTNGGRILEATGLFKALLADDPHLLEEAVEGEAFGLHVATSAATSLEALKEEVAENKLDWRMLRLSEWRLLQDNKLLWGEKEG